MKRIIIPILIIIPLAAWGQRITYSSEILNTKDSSIVAVRDLWKVYITKSQMEFDKTSLSYWNKFEIDQGFTDIVKAAVGIPSYQEYQAVEGDNQDKDKLQ